MLRMKVRIKEISKKITHQDLLNLCHILFRYYVFLYVFISILLFADSTTPDKAILISKWFSWISDYRYSYLYCIFTSINVFVIYKIVSSVIKRRLSELWFSKDDSKQSILDLKRTSYRNYHLIFIFISYFQASVFISSFLGEPYLIERILGFIMLSICFYFFYRAGFFRKIMMNLRYSYLILYYNLTSFRYRKLNRKGQISLIITFSFSGILLSTINSLIPESVTSLIRDFMAFFYTIFLMFVFVKWVFHLKIKGAILASAIFFTYTLFSKLISVWLLNETFSISATEHLGTGIEFGKAAGFFAIPFIFMSFHWFVFLVHLVIITYIAKTKRALRVKWAYSGIIERYGNKALKWIFSICIAFVFCINYHQSSDNFVTLYSKIISLVSIEFDFNSKTPCIPLEGIESPKSIKLGNGYYYTIDWDGTLEHITRPRDIVAHIHKCELKKEINIEI